MMSLARRLSYAADTTVGCACVRCVSRRMPLPEGTSKAVILPMARVQFAAGFSAVMRSWMEWPAGGTSGFLGAGRS